MTGGPGAASFRSVSAAALIQLAVSAVAVLLLTLLAAWATRGRAAPPLDEAQARHHFAEEFPDATLDGLWLSADGRGALARAGDKALVLARLGDGYVARPLPWSAAVAAEARDGKVRLPLREPGAPAAVLAFASWPPNGAIA